MPKYHYRALPRGNEYEFEAILAYLRKQGVRLEWSRFPRSGAMFRWPVEDTPRLPTDDGVPYFGTEESGHGIFNITDAAAEDWVREFDGAPWERLS